MADKRALRLRISRRIFVIKLSNKTGSNFEIADNILSKLFVWKTVIKDADSSRPRVGLLSVQQSICGCCKSAAARLIAN